MARLANANGHKSHRWCLAFCLAPFDEPAAIGLDAFTGSMPQWTVDAAAARPLAGAMRNDHV